MINESLIRMCLTLTVRILSFTTTSCVTLIAYCEYTVRQSTQYASVRQCDRVHNTTTSHTVNNRTWSGRPNRTSYRTTMQFLDWQSEWTTSQNRIDLSFIETSPTPNAIEIQPGIKNSCHETLIVKNKMMCGVIVVIIILLYSGFWKYCISFSCK